MAFVNATAGEVHCKIVYYGPGLGGKTTNLEEVYRRMPTDRRGEFVSLKSGDDRTLYFDLLPLDLGRVAGLRTRFHVYTVPGQPCYDATRRLVLRGADGLVFVADSHPERLFANRESLDNLRSNLARELRPLEELPIVFQYNKRDLPGAVPVARLAALLNAGRAPSFEAIASRGVGVLPTLRHIIGAVLTEMASAGAAQEVSG